MALIDEENLELLPISELIKLDIERYGRWAYLMYKINVIPAGYTDCTSNRDFILWNYHEYDRKLYANIPFNLEWAKAGLVVSHVSGGVITDLDIPDRSDCSPCGFVNGVSTTFYNIGNLCHPFLPTKELGL